MSKRILPLALLSLLAAAAALLIADRRSPSRESLLPVLLTVKQHEKQLDRAVSKAIPLSPEEERRIGEGIDGRLAASPARSAGARAVRERDAQEGLVRELGRPLAANPFVARFRGRYEFRVLDQGAAVNAFAIPGGFVYVLSGLLRRFARDPAALEFVLAHEIGHVELGHCADAYRTSAWLRGAGLGGLGDVAQLFRALNQLQFSEVQELEADQYALRLLAAAGRDPRAGLRAMDLLGLTASRDAETKRDPGAVVLEGLSDYLRTHPGSWRRRAALEEELERLSGPRRSVRPGPGRRW